MKKETRNIICAILFAVAGITYLAAAIKGNIPLYYIFGILLLLIGILYVKKAITERKTNTKETSKKVGTKEKTSKEKKDNK